MKLSRNRKAVVTRPFMWGPIGFAVARASHPVLNDLIQWLYALPSTDADLPDNSGLSNDALRVQSACVGFNGLDQYLFYDTGSTSDNYFGACTISGYFNADALGSNQTIMSIGASAYRLLILTTGNIILCRDSDTGVVITAGIDYHYEVDFDALGRATELRLNNVVVWTGEAEPGETLGASTFYFGARELSSAIGLFFSGRMWEMEISGANGGTWPMAEINGDTCYDTSGNGNHMTLNAGSGSIEVMRSYRQDVHHANFDNGGSKGLVFDGSNGAAIATNQDTAYLGGGTDFDFSITMDWSDTANGDKPASHGQINVEGWYLNASTLISELGFVPNSDGTFSAYNIPFVYSGFQTVRFQCVSGDLTIYVDGTPIQTFNSIRVMTIPTTYKLQIGARGPTVGLITGELIEFSAVGGVEWRAATAYGTTIPDYATDNPAVISATGVVEKFYPATDANPLIDTRGLPCTNVADGKSNPNCETKTIQSDTAPNAVELLKNTLDNPNGTGFEAVSYGDELEWVSGYDNVWVRKYADDNGLTRTERLTYFFDKEWTLPEFNRQLKYLGITADDTNAVLDVNGDPALVGGYVEFTA